MKALGAPEAVDSFAALNRAFAEGVSLVPTGGKAKTWTYTPTMSVTVSGGDGLRIAVRLFWDSLVAIVRRSSVTFEAGTSAPYTIERDA